MKIADIAAALSLEALQGSLTAFDRRIADIRPHKGQRDTCENVLALAGSSKIIENHINCEKIQDAYSLRCVSQVHGASKDALRRAAETVCIEMNSVTDNPIVMADTGEIISGGNFHGQPVALVMDYLKIAISEIGNISERRINRQLDAHLSSLPAFLTTYPGINSGFMILQYTAASLVSENKVLAHPASVDSIPTSANQEDHVSMGTIAARKAREIYFNASRVVAIELIASAQAIDLNVKDNGKKLGKGAQAAYNEIRKVISKVSEDRELYLDFNKAAELIDANIIVEAVEEAVGALK